METNLLLSTSVRVLNETRSLEFKFVSLNDYLIIVEDGLKVLDLGPLHAADRSDSDLHFSHGGSDIIQAHIFLLTLLHFIH